MESTLMTEPAATPTDGQTAMTGAEQSAAPAPAEVTATEQGQQQQAAVQDPANPTAQADKANEQGGKQEEAKPQGAPEKYEFQAPEGLQLDDSVMGAFGEVAKDLNLSQEQAQKFIDKVGPLMQAQQVEALTAVSSEWAEAAKVDKEFGGDKLNENLAMAKKAMDQFASPELRTLLNESALGNNPEFIRLFYRVGKAISEDGFVVGGNAKSTEQSVAQRLYPNMNP